MTTKLLIGLVMLAVLPMATFGGESDKQTRSKGAAETGAAETGAADGGGAKSEASPKAASKRARTKLDQRQKTIAAKTSVDPRAKDRRAIEAKVQSYVDAYNEGNAKSVAEHWSKNGVWVDHESGQQITGAIALAEHFQTVFAADDRPVLNLRVSSIRFIADNVAVEDGVAQLVDADGVSESGYTAIHVKENGEWKVDSVRENAAADVSVPASASNYENLRELEWMVGDWTDVDETSTTETSCSWTKNRNFLTQTFRVVANDRVEMEGTQVIGWDPANEVIRSWVFDSEGGFGQGVWSRKGNRWVVKSAHTLSDGGTASAVNIFRYVDETSYGWQSIGREIDGEFAPNIDEVIVTRAAAE